MKQLETTIDVLLLNISSFQKILGEPFVDPLSRTYWLGLLIMIPITYLFYLIKQPDWNLKTSLDVAKTPSFGWTSKCFWQDNCFL